MGLPSISVVMPVYNALPYLDESINSILNQTFTDFEFVILDDASTDGSTEILRRWAQEDRRIRLYVGESNLGPTGSSNFVVKAARAPLVARMDADDISFPDRLRKQWEAMQSHHEVALLGTLSDGITTDGRYVLPVDRWQLARRSNLQPCAHGSIMFRREIFDQVGGYREECAGWEDFDLFSRIRQKGRIFVLTDALYHYRYQVNSIMGRTTVRHVEQVICLEQPCWAEINAGGNNERAHTKKKSSGIDLEALADSLYRVGFQRLLSGQPPKILSAVYQYKVFGLRPRFLRTLVLATWGAVSHKSLRLFLRSYFRGRDFLGSCYLTGGEMYEWRPENARRRESLGHARRHDGGENAIG
jgi:glycosyltransferase involved in cell wall biosynthesis